MEISIKTRGLSKVFEGNLVLQNVDINLCKGDRLGLLGESGAGKTTLLKIIQGLIDPTSGEVFIKGKNMRGVLPALRSVRLVFQEAPIFFQTTVREHVTAGLKVGGVRRVECERRLAKVASLLKIEDLLDRKTTDGLSGGQRKRIHLASVLILEPEILLFDEPFAGVDPRQKYAMCQELIPLVESLGVTFMYVTHDPVELAIMCNKTALLACGSIAQTGNSLVELHDKPNTVFVAKYLGYPSINLFKAEDLWGLSEQHAGLTLGVRPEDIKISRGANSKIKGRVEKITPLISTHTVTILTKSGLRLVSLTQNKPDFRKDEEVEVFFTLVHFFDEKGKRVP